MTNLNADRHLHLRSGRRLEYVTLGWNLLECVVAIAAGAAAGSAALVGFGVDSIIESLSGAVLLWRLRARDDAAEAARESRAHRLVGICFLLLAGWVLFDAGSDLVEGEAPDESLVGIVLAALSLVVMPILARAKRRVAGRLESGALHADARQTDLCFWLSAILLGGLGLNALFGWWWADPVAALAMVPIIVLEGRRALRGESCGCG